MTVPYVRFNLVLTINQTARIDAYILVVPIAYADTHRLADNASA